MNGAEEEFQFAGAISRQLIVFYIHAKGVAAALLVALPMIANTILHKFEVSIEQRFSLAAGGGKYAASRQGAAEVVPVCGRRARREYLAEHRDLLVGIESLAQ